MPAGSAPAGRFRVPQALLALEAGAHAAPRLAQLVAAAPPAEWEAALDLLTRHGVAPYLHHLLARERLLDVVPPPFAAGLRERHRSAQIEHFRLLEECRRLAALFRGGGVRAVPFKGAALFTTLYEQPGLRPMQDLDWLVRREELPRAEALLAEAGYRIPGTLDARRARRLHFHLAFTKGGDGTRVELHWNLADEELYPPARLDAVWAGVAESADSLLRLDPCTTLLHLCVHAARHGALNSSLARRAQWRELVFDPLSGNRLIWLLDIRRLLARGGCPPAEALPRAAEWGIGETVAGSLLLAQEVFGAVPGWEETGAALGRGPRGPRGIILDRLAQGLARGNARSARLLERLQRLDHARELRLIRGLDLLDLLVPRPGEADRWRRSGRGALLPLLYAYRAATGPFAIAARLLPWLRPGG